MTLEHEMYEDKKADLKKKVEEVILGIDDKYRGENIPCSEVLTEMLLYGFNKIIENFDKIYERKKI